MVAHPRKTPSPGALRSIKPKPIKPKPIKPKPVTPKAVTPKAVNPERQDLQFRSLNLPVPIEVVENNAGRPTSIILPPARLGARPSQKTQSSVRSLTITSINDLWQVDDEWWREHPISRRYYQVTTQDERRLTIFQDQLNGSWYWQKGE